MAIQFAKRDLAAFERASSALLSPFAFETTDAWRHAARLAVEEWIGGEGSSFTIFAGGVPVIAAPPYIAAALETIVPPPEWVVRGMTTRRQQLGLHVADWTEIYDLPTVRRSEFYNDVVRPSGILAPLQMVADTGLDRIPASIAIYSSDEKAAARCLARRKDLLHLLYPAYAAGMRTFLAFRHRQFALSRMAESTVLGVVFFDGSCRVRQENEYFQNLVAAEPDRARVRAEVARIARNSLTLVRYPAVSEQCTSDRIHTSSGCYRITAMVIDEQWSGDSTAVVAIVERVTRGAVAAARLTPRELEIAQLVRAGMTTREIADCLAISVNTARRHVERILAKLDVHNRTAAAMKLFGS
jgi:DNA-binding CsgD family transcriptional regulator